MSSRSHDPSVALEQRIPPQNIEAEQATLGAMLLEREAIVRALDLGLTMQDFYRDAHRAIYKHILALYADGKPVDLITLGTALKAQELYDMVGGGLYLTTLMQQVPTAAGIRHYGGLVLESARRRRFIKQQFALLDAAYRDENALPALMAQADKGLSLLQQEVDGGREIVSVGEMMSKAIADRRQADAQNTDLGIHSGVKALDKILRPLMPKELIIIAGRPGTGKSALAAQLALCIAQQDVAGIFYSLEMDQDSLALRIFASYGVNPWAANSLHYRQSYTREVYETGYNEDSTGKERPGLQQVADQVERLPVYFVDTPALKPSDILSDVRHARYRGLDIGFVVIDYLQLLDSNERARDTFDKVRMISRELKQVAKTLGIVIIGLAQLNRDSEKRFPPRPLVSDLRESGQLEQDADKILLLYRPGMYGPRAIEAAELESGDTSSTEIILAKQRNGGTGETWMTFDHARTWFVERGG